LVQHIDQQHRVGLGNLLIRREILLACLERQIAHCHTGLREMARMAIDANDPARKTGLQKCGGKLAAATTQIHYITEVMRLSKGKQRRGRRIVPQLAGDIMAGELPGGAVPPGRGAERIT